MRGFNDAYGSWNTICISFRACISVWCEQPASSIPLNRMEPDVGVYSCAMARAAVDFPQPDSPTSPSVSPFLTEKLMPSTARIAPFLREKRPPSANGKCIFKSLTVNNASDSLYFSSMISASYSLFPAASAAALFDTEAAGTASPPCVEPWDTAADSLALFPD